jgi:hypothetical protein
MGGWAGGAGGLAISVKTRNAHAQVFEVQGSCHEKRGADISKRALYQCIPARLMSFVFALRRVSAEATLTVPVLRPGPGEKYIPL